MLSKEKEKVEPTTIAQEIVANGTPVGISPNKCQNWMRLCEGLLNNNSTVWKKGGATLDVFQTAGRRLPHCVSRPRDPDVVWSRKR